MTVPGGEARTLALLDRVPEGSAAALVLRHAERENIPSGTFGNDVPLTVKGRQAAHRLGVGLSARPTGIIKTSPLLRCVQTAESIVAGSGWTADVIPDMLLGDPGPFVIDAALAGSLILDIGIVGVATQQLSSAEPPDGMRSTSEGVRLILNSVADALCAQGGTSVFVTHDVVLAVLVGTLYGMPVDGFRWPDYLDALVLWADSDRLRSLWYGLDEGSYPIGGRAHGLPG